MTPRKPPRTSVFSLYEKLVFDMLMECKGEFVSKQTITQRLYNGAPPPFNSNCLEVFISRLRKKGARIETKRKSGYRIPLEQGQLA